MLKEWVIVLTKDEKRTFYGFYGLFLGSTLVLMMIIGWLFYHMQSDHFKDLTISKMHPPLPGIMENVSLELNYKK